MKTAGRDFIGLGVGAFIVNNKNKVLLMLRSKYLPDDRTTVGMWSIPGGQVHFGETCKAAVAREAKEELGIGIEIVKLIGYTDQILKTKNLHWHSMHYLCKIKKGTPTIKEPDKCDAIKWFPLKKLPSNAGITHVVRPTYLLGKMKQAEYNRRLLVTSES